MKGYGKKRNNFIGLDSFINSNNFDLVFDYNSKDPCDVLHYNYDNGIKLIDIKPGYLLFNNYIFKTVF